MDFQLIDYAVMQLIKQYASKLDIKSLFALGQTSTEWRDFVNDVFKEMAAIDCVVPSKAMAMKIIDRCDGEELKEAKFITENTNEMVDLFEGNFENLVKMAGKIPKLFVSTNYEMLSPPSDYINMMPGRDLNGIAGMGN